jgi:hypothetical protein
MSSNNYFSTAGPEKQGELIHRFMEIYKSNPKIHGCGLKEGMTFDNNNDKWKPKITTEKKEAKEEEWELHLSGERFLGLGPPLDNATCWWACIDVDQIRGVKYEVDYGEEMGKLKQSGLPLVADRSKNNGIHLKIFFTEPVPCDIVRKVLWKWAAQLGYAGQEIFPKQFSELGPEDYPNWVFMPYGPTWGEFGEQCGMTETGNAITMEEYLIQAEKKRISLADFTKYLKDDSTTNRAQSNQTNYKSNGLFVPERATVEDTFKGGPPCLMTLAKMKVHSGSQHSFLFECGTFLKKKYPDNWSEAMKWINMVVLVPPGDTDKLKEIIDDHRKHVGPHAYEFRCHDQPMESYCYSMLCARAPYGVGNGKNKPDFYELGLSYINRVPRIWTANVGGKRVSLSTHELFNVNSFREKCAEYGADFPSRMKAADWDLIVRKAIENATSVEPTEVMKTDAFELEMLQTFFDTNIFNSVRSMGEEYLNGGGRNDDSVRMIQSEGQIYWKWLKLQRFCRLKYKDSDVDRLRWYVENRCKYHGKERGAGTRAWYRCTYSIGFDMFDEEIVGHWLNPDREEKDGE